MSADWNGIMFNNIGKKIRTVAVVVAWSNIICSILVGIILFFLAFINLEELWYYILLTPLVVAFGCVLSWLSVITLYGFGKLIEDVEAIRNSQPQNTACEITKPLQAVEKNASTPPSISKPIPTPTHQWRCDTCGKMRTTSPCEYCGKE